MNFGNYHVQLNPGVGALEAVVGLVAHGVWIFHLHVFDDHVILHNTELHEYYDAGELAQDLSAFVEDNDDYNDAFIELCEIVFTLNGWDLT